MAKKQKNIETLRRSEKELKPLIDALESGKVTANQLTERLSKKTGRTEYPANIREWLDPDIKERIEMRHGVGQFLLDIWKEIQAETVGKDRES